jgi:hypothetical protein
VTTDQYCSEPKFLNIYWRLKSPLFEESCLSFQRSECTAGLTVAKILCVLYFKDFSVLTVWTKKKIKNNDTTFAFYIENICGLIWKPWNQTYSPEPEFLMVRTKWSRCRDVILEGRTIELGNRWGREKGMGREWGGQFTSNLGPGWTRIAPHRKEGFQVRGTQVQGELSRGCAMCLVLSSCTYVSCYCVNVAN